MPYFFALATCLSLLFHTLVFAVLPGATTRLSTGTNNNQPQVVVNSAGNAIAVWVNPFTNQILASTFNGTSWIGPIQIAIGNPPQIEQTGTIALNSSAQIGIDQNGNGLVVSVNPTNGQVQASIFNARTGLWSSPLLLGVGISPQIATVLTGNNGNIPGSTGVPGQTNPVVIAWLSQDINLIRAATVNLSTVSITSGPVTIASVSTSTNNITSLIVRANTSGNAAAIWTTFSNLIQGATFSNATKTWSFPVTLATNSGFQSLALDQNNFGIVAWQNFTSGTIFVDRFAVP